MKNKKSSLLLQLFLATIAIIIANYYMLTSAKSISNLQKLGDIISIVLQVAIAYYVIFRDTYKKFNFKYNSIVIGALVGLTLAISLIGLAALNPKNIDWLMGEMDRRQHFLGWNFFVRDSWRFPLGFFANWAYPNGMSVMFTDSISLAAIFFKLFKGILPDVFQYLGMWLYLSFVLMGSFIAFIFDKVTDDLRTKAMLSMFFILTPIMFLRVDGHTSLTSQWIILWALYLIINEKYEKKYLYSWIMLFALCVLIHPYFLFMNYIIFGVHLFKGLLLDKKIGIKDVVIAFISTAVVVVFMMFIAGYFEVKASGEAFGLGEFSMNLNAFFNPIGTSRIIGDVLAFPYQYEGMAYLGVGGILVIFLAIISVFIKGYDKSKRSLYISLGIISFVLVILAASNKGTFGPHILWNFKASGIVGKLWGIIRSTGRMIWPVWYILTIFAFMKVIKTNVKRCSLFVAVILAIQLFDLSGMYMKTRRSFVQVRKWQNPLQDDFWNKAKDEYTHIAFVKNIQKYAPMAYFASMNGLTMDCGYFARDPESLKGYLEQNKRDLISGNFNEDTLYILNEDDEVISALVNGKNKDLVKELDGYVLFSPKGFK